MYALLRWWFIACSTVSGIVIAHFYGFFNYAWKVDQTKMTFVILAVFAVLFIFVGLLTYHARNGDQLFKRHRDLCYYGASSLPGLGLVGTVAGFLLLLRSFKDFNPEGGPAAIHLLVHRVADDMSTAGLPTITGIALWIILNGAIVNLNYLSDDHGK